MKSLCCMPDDVFSLGQALVEISKSPWKTIKYVFDREVSPVSSVCLPSPLPLTPQIMEVFTALNNVMKGKQPFKK